MPHEDRVPPGVGTSEGSRVRVGYCGFCGSAVYEDESYEKIPMGILRCWREDYKDAYKS
ncbi:MAG: hypothetical protein V4449_02265 [Patescibacteria group bacterium]